MRVLTSVQALRACAALLVICVHVGNPDGFEVRYLHATAPLLAGLVEVGRTGVDLFFVISGFIMTVTSFGRPKPPSSALFLIGRVIRIYPPLWIVTTLILAVYLWHPSLVNSHSPFPPDIAASFFALPQQGSPLLLVSWSLTYEMYFYCIFAVALLSGKRTFLPVLAAWAAVMITLNLRFGTSPNPWLVLVANPLCFEFLLGVGIGWLVVTKRYGWPLASLMVGIGWYLSEAFFGFGSGWWRVAAALPLGLILFGAVGIERRSHVALPAFLTHLGDSSYSVYLWHIPMLAGLGFIVGRFSVGHGSTIREAIVLAICITVVEAVALIIFRYVERPMTAALREFILQGRSASMPLGVSEGR